MEKYIFAFINFFDNELSVEYIYSDKGPIETALDKLNSMGFEMQPLEEYSSLADVKMDLFNADAMFELVVA
jgi:hypothetical protein